MFKDFIIWLGLDVFDAIDLQIFYEGERKPRIFLNYRKKYFLHDARVSGI